MQQRQLLNKKREGIWIEGCSLTHAPFLIITAGGGGDQKIGSMQESMLYSRKWLEDKLE